MAQKIELRCTGYQINRDRDSLPEVNVRLILMQSPRQSEEIAEALKKIELYLSGSINLVKASDKPRCFYCGTLNNESENSCTQCGGPL